MGEVTLGTEHKTAEIATLSPSTETLILGFMLACTQLRWLDSKGKDPPHLSPLLPNPGREH